MSNYFRSRRFAASAGAVCLLVVLLCWRAVPQQVTSSTTVSAANLALTATGSHIQASATGNDTVGTIAISSSNSSTITFNYVCIGNPS